MGDRGGVDDVARVFVAWNPLTVRELNGGGPPGAIVMPSSTYLPSTEAELRTWVQNFSIKLELDPTGFGTTTEQASILRGDYDTYVAAFTVAKDPDTNSKTNTRLKNEAKDVMVKKVRELVRIVQAWPGMTDAKRDSLGITVPDPDPSPAPIPSAGPTLEVVSVLGRTVVLKMKNADKTRRGRPVGAIGASIFAFIGPEVPTKLGDWEFVTLVTKTVEPVDFAASVPAGSKVWLTAFWYNRNGKTSPAGRPISTYLDDGLTMAA